MIWSPSTSKKEKLSDEERLQHQIENYETRFSAVGETPPESEKESNLLLKALDVLDRPRNAVLSGLTGQGFMKGLTGETHVNVADLLENKIENPYLRGAAGFVGDVLLDPLTYLTLGTAGAAKGAAQQGAKTMLKFAGQNVADVTPITQAIGKGVEATRIPELLGPVFNPKHIRKAVTSTEELPDVEAARDLFRETQRLTKGQQQEALDELTKAYQGVTPEAARQAAHIIEAPTQLAIKEAESAIPLPKQRVTVRQPGKPASVEDLLTNPPLIPKQTGELSIEKALGLPEPAGMAGAEITQRAPGLGRIQGEAFQVKPGKIAEQTLEEVPAVGVRTPQAGMESVLQAVKRGTLDKKELNNVLGTLNPDEQKQFLDDIYRSIQGRLPANVREELRKSQIPKASFKGQRFTEKQLLEYRKQVEKGIEDLNIGMAKYMRDSAKEAATEGDIYRQIRERGGIRSSTTGYLKEEYRTVIPIGLRNKYGLAIDEMADELGISAEDLLGALRGRKQLTGFRIADYVNEAAKMLEKDPDYQTKLRAVAKIDELLGNLAPEKIPAEIKALLPKITRAEDVLKPEVKAQVEKFIASPVTKPLLEKLKGMESVAAVKPARLKTEAEAKIKNMELPASKELQVGFEKKPIAEAVKSTTATTREMLDAARQLGYKTTPEGRLAARIAKQISDQTAKRDIAADVQFAELPNYIRHLYKDDWQTVKKVFDAWAKKYGNLPGKLAGFQKERKFPTLIEAKKFAIKELGIELHPVEDVRVLTAVREMEGIQQRNINEMYRKLQGMGPNVIQDARTAPAGWKTLPIKQLENKAIHPEVARFLERFNSTFNTDEGMKTFLTVLGGVQNFWKGLVTAPNPAFHIRNAMSNAFNNFLGGVVNPEVYRLAVIAQRGGNEVLKIGGKEYEAKELRKMFREKGLEGFGFFAGETPKSMIREATERFEKLPAVKQISLIRIGRKGGDWLESNAKMAHFIDRLNKGDAPEEAAKSVRKYLFDYGDLTEAEKKIRDFVPFYTFTRKNLPLQLEKLITNPGKMTALYKLVENAKAAHGTEEDDTPAWMKSELAIPLGDNKHLMLDLPLTQLSMLGGEKTLKNALGMISPLAKIPIELAMGRQIFSGVPIEKYPGATARFGNIDLPANIAYGLSQLGPMPRTAADIAGAIMEQQPKEGFVPAPPEQIPFMGTFVKEVNPEREQLLNLLRREQQLADFRKYLEESKGIEVPTVTELKKKKGGYVY